MAKCKHAAAQQVEVNSLSKCVTSSVGREGAIVFSPLPAFTALVRYIDRTSSCEDVKVKCLSFLCQAPLQMDQVLNLSQDGIRLIFDPVSQRLKVSLRFCT